MGSTKRATRVGRMRPLRADESDVLLRPDDSAGIGSLQADIPASHLLCVSQNFLS
jgi:hypothetical protein